MKKISTLILSALLAWSACMAQDTGKTNDVAAASGDSIVATVAAADSAATLVAENEPESRPSLFVEDGYWMVDYNGRHIRLSDADTESVSRIKGLEGLEGLDDDSLDALILKDNMGMAAVIVALIFGLPCITIVVALIVILYFALKRNRGRNELINNAIEHDYQLPDAFYSGQKSATGPNGQPARDSRKFYKAISLLSTGIALIVFAFIVDAPFFVLAGGIPFLIGVGQMIGYFCIPNTEPIYRPGPTGGFQPPYPPRQPWENNGEWQAPSGQPYGCNPQQGMPGEQPRCDNNGCDNDRQTPPPYNPA